jgi:hypothetical protein
MRSSPNALFFLGHPPCDFNALILFLDFMVAHNDHLISQESLTAKTPGNSDRYPNLTNGNRLRRQHKSDAAQR